MEILSVASRLALEDVSKQNPSHTNAFLDAKNLPKTSLAHMLA